MIDRQRLEAALLSDDDGCWAGEDCCQASLDALLPVIAAMIEEAQRANS